MRHLLITLVALIALSYPSYGVSCSNLGDCLSGSTQPHWVNCVSNTCTCAPGAAGSATSSDKCRCESPKSRVLLSGVDYCIDVAGEIAADAKCKKQIDILKQIYRTTIYPNNLPAVGHPEFVSHLFHPDVQGRVTPLGQYPDLEGVVEYYYALAASDFGNIIEVVLKDVRCEGDGTWARVDLLGNFTLSPLAAYPFFNFTHFVHMKHADDARVLYVDATFLNLGASANIDPNEFFPAFGVPRGFLVKNSICETTQTFCTGLNQQYASYQDCMSFLDAIPWGTWDRGNANSTVCRQLHVGLTPVRPHIHCHHVGPMGGGKCVDFTPQSFYSDHVEEGYSNEILGVRTV